MRTNVTETSLDAFFALKSTPQIQAQQLKILNVMQAGVIYTRRELAHLTGIETSTVSARINAMLGLSVDVVGTRKCPITGVTVQALVRL